MLERTWLVVFPLTLAAALGLGSAPGAQTVMRFDMGSATSPVASHFIQIARTSAYSSVNGYGWVTLEGAATPRDTPVAECAHNHPSALIQDSILIYKAPPATGQAHGIFRVDLSPGTYYCVAYLGDLGEPLDGTPLYTPLAGMQIGVNDSLSTDSYDTVASGIFARQQISKASFTNAWGGYKRVPFLATVDSGADHLHVRFTSADGDKCGVMGLEIYDYTEPPITFDHDTNELVSASTDEDLQDALEALNDDDYAAARTSLDAVTDDLELAWGYAWLIGWLTDAQEQVDFDLLATTKTLLQGLSSTDSSVVGLLQDVEDFEMGAEFVRNRGYGTDVYPTNNYSGILGKNLNAGTQLLQQLDDDILAATADPDRPDCPLAPKAKYLAARTMYGRNTRVFEGDALSVPYNQHWLGLLAELWPRLDPTVTTSARLYPKAHEAAGLAWMMDTHVLPTSSPFGGPGPLQSWDESYPALSYGDAWWDGLVTVSTAGTPPRWAAAQRQYAHMFRKLGQWWMANRLENGQLGGGAGDDTEGAGALAVPALVRTEGAGNEPEEGARAVLEKVLYGSEVNVEEGYTVAISDHEHGGEYTTYPLFILMPTFPGRPQYIEFAMRTLRNMDDSSTHTPACSPSTDDDWSGIPGWSDFRHLRSLNLSGCAIDEVNDQDIIEAMKVLSPGFSLLDYNRQARLAELWEEFGYAWREAAMGENATSTGFSYDTAKPDGVFPAAVDYSSGEWGENGEWWSVGGIEHNTGEMYELMLTMYEITADPAFLDPIDSAVDWLAATTPNGSATAGTDPWTADKLKEIIAGAAFRAADFLPISGGQASDAEVDEVIDDYAAQPLPALHASRRADGEVTMNKLDMRDLFERDCEWLEHFWPFASTLVTFVDRIFFVPWITDSESSLHVLYSSQTGAPYQLAPLYPVTWFDAESGGGELDAAILVTHVDSNPEANDPPEPASLAFRAVLWNFTNADRDFGLRIWRDLPLGEYEILRGPDSNQDDHIDGTPASTPLSLGTRIQDVILADVPDGELHVVELHLVDDTAPTPCRFDLGIGPDDVVLVDDPGSGDPDDMLVRVTVHNLGSVNYSQTLHAYTLEVSDGTTTITPTIPTIDAAITTLDPQAASWTTTLAVDLSGPPVTITAEIVVGGGQCQLTTQNDLVEKEF